MKRQLFKLLPLLAIASLTGCSTYQYTSRYMGVDRDPINSKQMLAEVDVNFNLKVTSTSNFCLTKNDAIREAEYMCILKYGIDVVVDPIVKIEYVPTEPKRKYKATIFGFAGVYRNAPNGVDAVVDYEMEDVEKYKMMTDPSFAQHYYNKSTGNTYYVNTRKEELPKSKVGASEEGEKSALFTKKSKGKSTRIRKY